MAPRNRNRIPFDEVFEILSLLPARSIVRFRIACKLWRERTLAPHFIKTHLDLARKVRPPSILLFRLVNDFTILNCDSSGDSWTAKYEFWTLRRSAIVRFHDSFNGILCISDDYNYIYLLNPATHDSFILPKKDQHQRVNLGFHPVTKEYKVVCLYTHIIPQCQVFTVGTDDSWRDIAIPEVNLLDGIADHCVVNGVMHFTTLHSIVTFDLKDECFKQFPFPIEIDESETICLLDLQGSICMSFLHSEQMQIWRFDIGEFGDNSNPRWTLLYSIGTWDVMEPMSPLCMHKHKILTREYLIRDDTSLNLPDIGYYAPDMLCCRDVYGNFGGNQILFVHGVENEAYAHVESLVSLPNQ